MSSPPTLHPRPSPPSRESPSSRPATPSSTHVQGSSRARSSILHPPNSRSHGGGTTTGRSSKTSQEQPDRQSQLAQSPKATRLERVRSAPRRGHLSARPPCLKSLRHPPL